MGTGGRLGSCMRHRFSEGQRQGMSWPMGRGSRLGSCMHQRFSEGQWRGMSWPMGREGRLKSCMCHTFSEGQQPSLVVKQGFGAHLHMGVLVQLCCGGVRCRTGCAPRTMWGVSCKLRTLLQCGRSTLTA